ncbi:tripartite tricarboxylate transporter family receptor [Bordetella bronchiseptica MBORD635]|uniref:Bug family tripartite tricarboxylate transporter substrate binding protein n=1 Tax=Bordetella bronchiseptica TaxID=518 RepID=UPI0004612EF5|nr:tripartite tricarboxylate transporter substrate binding protein [Bordetella bronchiseptica]KDC80027.1 tripartite tricarboxylate transporter family receptor [Bordetella bronchiseptica MBORD635]
MFHTVLRTLRPTKALPRTAMALAACLLVPLAAPAQAAWPERPITFIVPTAAGGSPDVVSRLLGQQLGVQLGQSVVIENKPGASGSIGAMAIARAKPDGYTIGYAPTTMLAINQFLYKKLPYDVEQDFDYVTEFIKTYNFLLVPAGNPANSVSELVAYLKKNPDGAFFASSGNGTTGHLSAEMFKQRTGVEMTHVPFTGSAGGLSELIAGRVDVMFDNTTSSAPLVQAGKLKAIAVTSPQRLPEFPDTPTMIESGVPDFDVSGWGGIIVPKGTPDDVIERLNREINIALQAPLVQDGFKKIGAATVGGSSEDMKAHVAHDAAMWGAVIRNANITME